MYISDVRIENYRTFQDVTFHFDSRANYIVGDNNIGKSNFLSFLKRLPMDMDSGKRIFLMRIIRYVSLLLFLLQIWEQGNLHISNFAS